jgi:Protein of unknown function (DUF1501)
MTVPSHPTNALDRRLFLKGALAGAASIALASQVSAAEPAGKAKACILLWMEGGPSQLDTFDLKPEAPAEIRGEFKPIQTKVKGIQICEHLPRLAKLTDKLALVRSMNTADADHQRGTYHMLTGFSPGVGISHPEMGAVIARYRGKPKSELPTFITFGGGFLARAHPGEGYLGPTYQPLRLASPDAAEGKLKPICDITEEWKKVGKIYGDSTFGKSCLAARRLIEAGVPFVSVTHGGYDVHSMAFPTLKGRMEVLDPAWSGLIRDLNDRGLLDSTLIVWMGEFGRTPKINASSGRDHWVRGWSVVLGGGGIKGGMVHGATDKTGMAILEKPVSEGDLLATIYTALGIDPRAKNKVGEKEVPLTPEKAKPIKEVLG